MSLPTRSSSPFSNILRSHSPPIPIPSKVHKLESDVDLSFAIELLEITSRRRHTALWNSLEKSIAAIDPSFHELNDDEIPPILERIIHIFRNQKKTTNKYVEKNGQLSRSIYFDRTEKIAYIYLHKGSNFNANPKFLKVIWNNGSPNVERTDSCPYYEDA